MKTSPIGEVHVKWRGLLGNRLFQLAGGLVLAIESGAKLRCLPLRGFPLVQFGPPDPPPASIETRHQEPAFEKEAFVELLQRGIHIVVNGHHEQYRHYREHKTAIRTLLTHHHLSSYAPTFDDLVVHLRLTGQNAEEPYNLDALLEQIHAWRKNRVIIVTDDPGHSFIYQNFRKPWAVVVKSSTEEDFATLLRANRLVLTPSTFGWWAAFLGRAEEIYFPFRQGIWKRPHIDLWVDDEPRYIKY